LARLGVSHARIRAGRPQTNGDVDALHRLILDESWRPAFARYLYPCFTGLSRERAPSTSSTSTVPTTEDCPAAGSLRDLVYGARNMEAR
jgi:hypothetical protein